MYRVAILCCAMTLLAGSPSAGDPPCSAPEYASFDFWLGTWDVRSAKRADAPPSRNVVTKVHGGCAVREQYTTPGGYSGTSLSFYDAKSEQWHQTWIDNQGQPLLLEGGLQGSSMVLESEASGTPLHRITWTPRKDGTVRQLWESSKDGGGTWTVVFDGVYSKVGEDG